MLAQFPFRYFHVLRDEYWLERGGDLQFPQASKQIRTQDLKMDLKMDQKMAEPVLFLLS